MAVETSVVKGTRVGLTWTATNQETGDPDTPNGVRVKYRAPGGTTQTITAPHASIENPSTGVYTYRHTLTVAGLWWFQFEAFGVGGPEVVDPVAIRAEATAL